MGFILALSRIYIPQSIRKRRLAELFQATADAFQCPAPPLEGKSFRQCLAQYALFTKENAEKSIQGGGTFEVKSRLHFNASQIGGKLREEFKIDTLEEAMLMSNIIYKILKIDFQGNSRGHILIRDCYFSSFYSGPVCRLISSLDEGLLAGLSGGRQLIFSQRITEGNTCCRAHLLAERNSI